MPYYGSNNYGWGDALAAWGQALSGIAMKRDEDAINRIKNYYGNNVEAWRQDALKNPQGSEAKYYKKLIGDPMRPLPEDPQVAQQRAMREQQIRWLDSLPPEQRKAASGILYGISPEIVGTVLRQIGQNQQAAVTPAERLKTITTVNENWPNATPAAKSQMVRYGTEGVTPPRVALEGPGDTKGLVGAMNTGGTAGLIGAMQKQWEPSSEQELLGSMGQTKQEIKVEDAKKRLQLAKDRFTALEENRKRIDARFEKTAKEREKRWNESLKYRMTPEQKMAYNASMKKYTQDFQLLNQTRKSAGEQLEKLKTKLAGMEANKSMVSGTDYEAQYNASMQQLEMQIDALQKQYDDTEYALDGLAIPGEETVQGAPSAAPSSPRIPLR